MDLDHYHLNCQGWMEEGCPVVYYIGDLMICRRNRIWEAQRTRDSDDSDQITYHVYMYRDIYSTDEERPSGHLLSLSEG